VSADDVQHVAARYLLPQRRSIARFLPQAPTADLAAELPAAATPVGTAAAIDVTAMPLPVIQTLSGGMPVIVQQADLSPSVRIDVMLSSGEAGLSQRGRPSMLEPMINGVRTWLGHRRDAGLDSGSPSLDPDTRLQQEFARIIAGGEAPATGALEPALIVVSGDIDIGNTIASLEQSLGHLSPPARPVREPASFEPQDRSISLGVPIAQAQLGYIVPAAAPGERLADAQRLLLYIVSHDYEGRLGKAAISKRGLAYWIGSEYRSNGSDGWITLAVGVDSDKLDALRALLISEFDRLLDDPPTLAEVEEAKSHFVGRARSAAQSNAELATALAQQWLWYGDTQTVKQLERRLAPISRQDVLDAIPAFIRGTTIVITQ
jgi:hypothetical protein